MAGVAPFGHRFDKGRVVEDEAEQATIKRMKQLRESEELSFANIAAVLNDEGLMNRGKYWQGQAVWLILSRKK